MVSEFESAHPRKTLMTEDKLTRRAIIENKIFCQKLMFFRSIRVMFKARHTENFRRQRVKIVFQRKTPFSVSSLPPTCKFFSKNSIFFVEIQTSMNNEFAIGKCAFPKYLCPKLRKKVTGYRLTQNS